MRTKHNFHRKKLFALCLSALMLGTTVSGLAACSNGDTSSKDNEPAESTKKTVGLIQNADFETDKFSETTPIVTSSTGWTRSLNSGASGSARGSQSASGIIDTDATAWENLTKGDETKAKLTDAEAEAQWDELSVWEKLAFYQDWEEREENDEKKLSDLSFYQSFNIDFDDIPAVANPLTHDYNAAENKAADNTKVLMIHNEYSSSVSATPSYKKAGTAQKYTSSSSVTVKAGTSAQFSVWVKTSDLTTAWTDGSTQPAVDKGAYISITHSVGGKTMDPLLVKNINTEGVQENNGWVQYEFLLNGSSYADTTFTIVLGLGLGGGTDYHEYVNGYAFFDDIQCKTISNKKYTELKTTDFVDVVNEDKSEFEATDGKTKYALAFHKPFTSVPFLTQWVSDNGGNATVGKLTTEKKNDKIYDCTNYPGLGFGVSNDKAEIYTNVAAMNNSGNAYLQKVYDQYFTSTSDFFTNSVANNPVLMLLSAEGASYTATYPTTLQLPKDSYMAISFFLKTSDFNSVTGAGVIVKDVDKNNTLSNLDTTNAAKVDIDDNTKDIYDGWQQCFIFLCNETDDVKEYELSFTLGSTTVVGTTKANYESGFAAFTNFQAVEMEKEEFEKASSGTYALMASLEGVQEEETGDSGFDSAVAVPFDALEKGFANAKNYKGVYADSVYLANGTNGEINQNETAGLLSRDYLTLEEGGVKTENTAYATILTNLGATGANNEARWNSLFGAETQQPLVIYNADDPDVDTTAPAYGYIGNTATVSADGYATVSLRVMVGGTATNAKASIYLVNTDSETFETLSSSRSLTYWYDKNGNICSKDPTASDFHAKKDVAFKKVAENGLYRANASWRNYALLDDADKTALFANLSAYTKTDSDGNLLVATDGVSYNYNDNWQNEGNDGIAFYKGTDGFYADKACTVKVKNLADITKENSDDNTKALEARYTAKKASLNERYAFEVANTNGKWVTVTFYIHAGNEPVNYRLEVWSGSRTGETNPENSFVAFDANKPDDVTADNFATLLNERKEGLAEHNYFENAFSFFDTDKFLRYNPELDENQVGDSYEDYDPTSHASGVAFLRYEAESEKELFVDLSYEYTSVSPDAEEDDTPTEEEETTDNQSNIWLLASSIMIAAVLLLAVVSLIVRKAAAKARRNRSHKAPKTAKESVKKAKKN